MVPYSTSQQGVREHADADLVDFGDNLSHDFTAAFPMPILQPTEWCQIVLSAAWPGEGNELFACFLVDSLPSFVGFSPEPLLGLTLTLTLCGSKD